MYRSLVIMLSASSSISFSAERISFSMWFFTLSEILSCSIAFSSRSKSLMEYQRCCSGGRSCTVASSIWARACSTAPEKVCMGMGFPFWAASTASSAASVIPVLFNADMVTTLHPNALESSSVFILSPFFSTTSIIFMAITTGIPSSASWVVRYRFLSRLVPSTMFKIASGRSVIR